MKKLPLTLLLVDSIPAKIYLAILNKNNLKPNKIIRIASCGTDSKATLISNFFGRFLGFYIIKLLKKLKVSRVLDARYECSAAKVLSNFNLSDNDLKKCLKGYSRKEIETVYCNSINDRSVKKVLEKDKNKVFLFTGGGILSDEILNTLDSKFFHIHPGIVPDIRGADCFFWSCLIKGRPGYSVFYMNAGIDTGDILYKREYEADFSYLEHDSLTSAQLKDLILSYYDPCLRIITFIEMLKKFSSFDFENTSLSSLPAKYQSEGEGRMYFFMHDLLVKEVLKVIFNGSESN